MIHMQSEIRLHREYNLCGWELKIARSGDENHERLFAERRQQAEQSHTVHILR